SPAYALQGTRALLTCAELPRAANLPRHKMRRRPVRPPRNEEHAFSSFTISTFNCSVVRHSQRHQCFANGYRTMVMTLFLFDSVLVQNRATRHLVQLSGE